MQPKVGFGLQRSCYFAAFMSTTINSTVFLFIWTDFMQKCYKTSSTFHVVPVGDFAIRARRICGLPVSAPSEMHSWKISSAAWDLGPPLVNPQIVHLAEYCGQAVQPHH